MRDYKNLAVIDNKLTLHVGPKPIARKRLTVDNLTEALLRAMTDVEMRKKAASLGERILEENGIDQAVNIIEQSLLLV